MASLLPTGHVSAAVGVLYMLALELRKAQESEAATLADGSFLLPLILVGGDGENGCRGAESVKLKIEHILLINTQDDLYEYDCLQVTFAPIDGRELPPGKSAVLFEPPYTKSFNSRRRSALARGIAHFYIDEVHAVAHFRRQLIASDLPSFVTDEDGNMVAIPPRYWASDRCHDVLKYDVSTLIKLDGIDVFGRVSFPKRDIDRLYSSGSKMEIKPRDPKSAEDAVLLLEAPPGQGSKFDAQAFASEVERIVSANNPVSRAKLARLALDAYEAAGHRGGRPSNAWAKQMLTRISDKTRSKND